MNNFFVRQDKIYDNLSVRYLSTPLNASYEVMVTPNNFVVKRDRNYRSINTGSLTARTTGLVTGTVSDKYFGINRDAYPQDVRILANSLTIRTAL